MTGVAPATDATVARGASGVSDLANRALGHLTAQLAPLVRVVCLKGTQVLSPATRAPDLNLPRQPEHDHTQHHA